VVIKWTVLELSRGTADGAGLPGITVTLSGTESRSTTTDGSGAYAFTELRAGSRTVTISGYPESVPFPASCQGYSLDPQVVELGANEDLTVNFHPTSDVER